MVPKVGVGAPWGGCGTMKGGRLLFCKNLINFIKPLELPYVIHNLLKVKIVYSYSLSIIIFFSLLDCNLFGWLHYIKDTDCEKKMNEWK